MVNGYEEFKMENGDSDTDKYPHRTGNIAGSDELYDVIEASPQQPLPNPSPKREGLFTCRWRNRRLRSGNQRLLDSCRLRQFSCVLHAC